MGIASFAMWSLIIASVVIFIIVIIGVRNSIASARNNEDIKRNGKEVIALITTATQHKNKNAEGLLSLQLIVEFNVGNEKTITQKDILVKIFHADDFKIGKNITIRYKENKPEEIVVLGNATN
ncbi:hypothetical protein N5923_08955 [Erwiniaceae bacterium BAC15a-03b]|uniref:DUF3592 domain-containing protein n=1 Tax=Winslowiella arboricola TaxID=2978220 RepID=A0A9J6PMH1_9GAMM|nr:hypothetical protein [Winslowiella arboricola]MCU5771710.1 hypothetical protein [Winslowiella arboricola]MCU5777619.1 hypothetical protein [Winslowiella arboricola]